MHDFSRSQASGYTLQVQLKGGAVRETLEHEALDGIQVSLYKLITFLTSESL